MLHKVPCRCSPGDLPDFFFQHYLLSTSAISWQLFFLVNKFFPIMDATVSVLFLGFLCLVSLNAFLFLLLGARQREDTKLNDFPLHLS